MSYKRVVKKKGKSYGPYIYESYRDENGKVQKRYLGKLEEKKKSLLLFFLFGFLALALVVGGSYTTDVLLNQGQVSEIVVNSVGAFFSTVVDGVTGLTISENITGVEQYSLYAIYEGEVIEQEFDTETIDLEIKSPQKFGGEIISKNKNKRMDFELLGGNLRLYFDLLNYSEFVGEVEDIIITEEIEELEAVEIIEETEDEEEIIEETEDEEEIIEGEADEEIEINETEQETEINETEQETEDEEEIIEGEADEEIEINETEEVEEVCEEVCVGGEEVCEEICTQEESCSESCSGEGEEEVCEETCETEESCEEVCEAGEEVCEEVCEEVGPTITGAIIRGITGFVVRITGFNVLEGNVISEETIKQIEEEITTEDIQKKIEELEEQEIQEIGDESVVEAEEFEVDIMEEESGAITGEEYKPDYKWGYNVQLNDLNFMAKIDVTSDLGLEVWNENTLKIGNQLLSFEDLIAEGYVIRIETPTLEMEVGEGIIGDISEVEEINQTEETDEEINEIQSNETSIGVNITEEEEEEEEEIEEEEEQEVAEEEEKEEEKEEETEISITGQIIRGLTGLVIETTEIGEEVSVADIKYENTMSIYIERDFTNTNYSVGDILFLDPTLITIPDITYSDLTNITAENNFTHLNMSKELPYYGNDTGTVSSDLTPDSWTIEGGWSGSLDSAEWNDLDGASQEFASENIASLTAGKTYKVTFTVGSVQASGPSGLTMYQVYLGGGSGTTINPTTGAKSYDITAGSGDTKLSFGATSSQTGAGDFIWLSSIEVKLIEPSVEKDLLVLYMPFDVNTSGTQYDYTNYSNDGTLINQTHYINEGLYGGGMEFDGDGDYITVSDSDSMDLNGNEMAFSVWLKPDFNQDGAASSSVFEKVNSGNSQGIRVFFSTGTDNWRLRLLTTSGGINCDTTDLTWSADTWHHFVGSYDGSNLRVYWDGVLENTCAQTGYVLENNDPLLIGGSPLAVSPFDGTMDELMIFDIVLDAGNISEIYNNQSKRFMNPGLQVFDDQTLFNISAGDDLAVITADYRANQGSSINLSVGQYSGGAWTYTDEQVFDGDNTFIIDTSTTNLTLNFTFLAGNSTNPFYSPILSSNVNALIVNVSSDEVAPDVTINYPANTIYSTSSINFNVTALDDTTVDSCWYTLNSGVVNYTMTNTTHNDIYNHTNSSIADGSYTADFYCNDTKNSINDSESVSFIIDTTYPAISYDATTDADGLTKGVDKIFVNVSSSDAVGNVSTFIDFDSSIIAWWRMDEIDGSGNPVDYFGNYDGTKQGNVVQTDSGYFGKGFELDGAGDGFSTGDLGVPLSANATLSMWIYFKQSASDYGNQMTLFCDGSNNGILSNSNANNYFYGPHSYFSGSVPNINSWNHVVYTYFGNDSTSFLYLNGIKYSPSATGGTWEDVPALINLKIGYRLSTQAINGTIDDVIIFNRTLSQVEVNSLYANTSSKYTEVNYTDLSDGTHTFQAYTQDMAGNVNDSLEMRTVGTDVTIPSVTINLPENFTHYNDTTVKINASATDTVNNVSLFNDYGLVSWWRMDDTNQSGENAKVVDYMKLNNGTAFANAVQTGAGKMGKGFEFDGAGDYINVSSLETDIEDDETGTISAWIYLNNVSIGNAIFMRNYLTETDRYLALQTLATAKFRFVYRDNTPTAGVNYMRMDTDNTLDLSRWYHVAVTSNGTFIKLYLNGTEQTVTTTGTNLGKWFADMSSGTYTNAVGKWSYLTTPNVSDFNGSIDDVLIFNRSLSAAEIQALYANSTTKYLNSSMIVSEGSHDITFYTQDGAGNVDSALADDIVVDLTYPTAVYGGGTDADGLGKITNSIFVNVSASDVYNVSTVINFNNSLVSWWRMDDVDVLGDPQDYIGSNDGFAEGGAVQTDAGKLGEGFSFDGGGDYINFSDPADGSLDFGTGDFAFSFWIKTNVVDSTDYIIEKAYAGSNTAGYQVSFGSNGYIGLTLKNGSTSDASSSSVGAIEVGKWKHVVISADRDGVGSIYINGVYSTGSDSLTDSQDWNIDSIKNLRVGASNTASNEFNGTIDDVMIFNKTLSYEEVIGLYANKSSEYLEVNYTSLADGVYTFDAYTQDLAGNVNDSLETRTVRTDITPPDDPEPVVNFSGVENISSENVICSSILADVGGGPLNVTVRWYLNGSLSLTEDYNNTYVNGTNFGATLLSGNTTKYNNWSCGMRTSDGVQYSNWVNASTNVSVVNDVPIVTLTFPTDASSTTNRTPEFNWTVSDADDDTITYDFNLTSVLFAGGDACSEANVFLTGQSDAYYIPATVLQCLWDNGYYYNWTVRAYDEEVYSGWTGYRTVNITAGNTFSLTNASMNFGSMSPLEENDTSDDSPFPFGIENDGTVLINISVNATYLWAGATSDSDYFQFKVDNKSGEEGAFDWLGSIIDWFNIPITGEVVAIKELNYEDDTDSAEVDVRIEVPPNEVPEAKDSTIIFYSRLAE